MTAPLGLGLIGAGKHGLRYARHIVDDLPEARLVALCRRDREEGERAAASFDCAWTADFRRLIEDPRVDAVVAAVPPTLNLAIAEAAARANKPLLLEKPLAASVAEGRRIRDLVIDRGLRCMVAHTLRFNGVVRVLRAHLHEIVPLQTMVLTQRFEPSELPWLDRRAESGGGIALHTGVHSFDLLYHLSGHEVGRVWGMVDGLFTRETEDMFSLLFQMRGARVHGSVSGSRTTLGRNGFIELGGERGQLVGDHVHGVAHLLRGRERTPLPVEAGVPTVREAAQAFVTAVRTAAPFPITVEDGLRAVVVADACYRSAALNDPIDLDP